MKMFIMVAAVVRLEMGSGLHNKKIEILNLVKMVVLYSLS